MENVVLCRPGRDFVEITQRECAIVASALGSLLKAAVDAENREFVSEIDVISRYFLSAAKDERVEGILLFAVSNSSLDRRLYKQVSE